MRTQYLIILSCISLIAGIFILIAPLTVNSDSASTGVDFMKRINSGIPIVEVMGEALRYALIIFALNIIINCLKSHIVVRSIRILLNILLVLAILLFVVCAGKWFQHYTGSVLLTIMAATALVFAIMQLFPLKTQSESMNNSIPAGAGTVSQARGQKFTYILGFTLSIIAIITSRIPFIGFIIAFYGLIFSILGIVYKKRLSIAGIIISSLALVAGLMTLTI